MRKKITGEPYVPCPGTSPRATDGHFVRFKAEMLVFIWVYMQRSTPT